MIASTLVLESNGYTLSSAVLAPFVVQPYVTDG